MKKFWKQEHSLKPYTDLSSSLIRNLRRSYIVSWVLKRAGMGTALPRMRICRSIHLLRPSCYVGPPETSMSPEPDLPVETSTPQDASQLDLDYFKKLVLRTNPRGLGV